MDMPSIRTVLLQLWYNSYVLNSRDACASRPVVQKSKGAYGWQSVPRDPREAAAAAVLA